MKLKVLVPGLALLFIFQYCRSDKYIPGICFEENILPIFVSNCSSKGCHNSIDSEEDFDLTSYEGIMKGIVAGHPLRSKIYNVISGKHPKMPPEAHKKLSSQEVDLIRSWIQFGAKNSIACNNVCDTSTYTFANRVSPLLNAWCVGCHSSSNAGGNVVLTDYNGIKNVAANGTLMGSINHAVGYSSMPKNTAKLPDCKIKIIKKWVDSGYPNN